MSKNRLPPKEMAKYAIVAREKLGSGYRETIKYFSTQKEAREWSKFMTGIFERKRLFKISYDFYQDLK